MSDEGDTPDQAPQAAAGQFQAEDAEARMDARPRRVVLRHDDTGSYQILMGHRLIQGFCPEFEEITGYAIGGNLQQQVRIHIEPIGRRQHAHYPDREPLIDDRVPDAERGRVRIRTTDANMVEGGPALFSSAHPHQPMSWQDQARRQVQEQMTRLQDMLNLLESM